MAITIQQLLKKDQTSTAEVARAAGISEADLTTTLRQPVATWPIGILNAVASVTHQTPSRVLQQLQDEPFTLEIDDRKQQVQGVPIPDPHVFALLQSVVKISCMEGWKPTGAEIVDLVSMATSSQPRLDQDFEQIFGE